MVSQMSERVRMQRLQQTSDDSNTYFMFDADGCLYNAEYRGRILAFIGEFSHAFAAMIFSDDKAYINEILHALEVEYRANWPVSNSHADDAVHDQSLNHLQVEITLILWEKLIERIAPLLSDDEKVTLDKKQFTDSVMEIFTRKVSELNSTEATELLNKLKVLQAPSSAIETIRWFVAKAIIVLYENCSDLLLHFVNDANPIIDKLLIETQRKTITCASARQSWRRDEWARIFNMTGSIILDLHHQFLSRNCLFDPIQLTDVIHDRPAGSVLSMMLKGTIDRSDQRNDERKAAIVYLIAQRAGIAHKGEKVTLLFFDDLSRITAGLFKFFSTYPNLLPENVTLTIIQYDGKIHSVDTVNGTGIYDYNYRGTIISMFEYLEKEITVAKSNSGDALQFTRADGLAYDYACFDVIDALSNSTTFSSFDALRLDAAAKKQAELSTPTLQEQGLFSSTRPSSPSPLSTSSLLNSSTLGNR